MTTYAKGQTSIEMLAVAVVIVLMFISAYIGIILRGEEISNYKRDTEMQSTVDIVATYMSVAQHAEGLRINTTLPSVVEGCTPQYTVHDKLLLATCGQNAFASRYLAANVTNGTSSPPFTISGAVIIENKAGTVKVTP